MIDEGWLVQKIKLLLECRAKIALAQLVIRTQGLVETARLKLFGRRLDKLPRRLAAESLIIATCSAERV